MRLCMMPACIFVSRFDITDLVNKIKIYTNLIKSFHFEIYIILFLFKSSMKNEYKYIHRKSDASMHLNYNKFLKEVIINRNNIC